MQSRHQTRLRRPRESRDSSSYMGKSFFVQDDDEEFPKWRPRARAKARGIPALRNTASTYLDSGNRPGNAGVHVESNWRPNSTPVKL